MPQHSQARTQGSNPRDEGGRSILPGVIGGVGAGLVALALAFVVMPRLGSSDADGGSGKAEEAGQAATLAVQGTGLEHPTLLASLQTYDEADVQASLAIEKDDYTYAKATNTEAFFLTDKGKEALDTNGFYVDATGYEEFYEVYEFNRYDQRANFVTVDSMMHTYHLYFAHLLKGIERSDLSDRLERMSKLMLEASKDQIEQVAGTEWENAAWRNVAYFAVGASLLDDETLVPEQVDDMVQHDLDAIYAANAIDTSAVTGADVDFSQFAPRGYYEGDDQLERYFRAMMWYGQINFAQKNEDLDRSAALMTLALQGEALDCWESIYAVTSFFAGSSDDNGWYEYKPLVDEAFGPDASAAGLASSDGFATFHDLTAQAKAPHINSIPFLDDDGETDKLEEGKGFRLMGQRFTLDAAIFQKLIYSQIGENSAGDKRMLPDALDIPAAFGSDEALALVQARGASDFSGYDDAMAGLREGFSAAPDDLWSASLYSQWLHTLSPLLSPKGEGYPPFMQTKAWTHKDLQTYLGSYTELKHDTVLYAKQVMAEMGGGPEQDFDDRGYVEPEPVVFSRLAALTRATAEGLEGYGMLGSADADNLSRLADLADQLATIATKELAGELPTDDEFELIRSYGGQLEHFWQEVYKDETTDSYFTARDFPAALVTDVATDPNGACLELGIGHAMTVYVLVPVGDEIHLASGSVYSFYQFEQPLSDRMTDSEWRDIVGSSYIGDGSLSNGVALEDWTQDFVVTYEW